MSTITLLKELKTRFFRDGVPDLSAQLAYYLLLSLFPFLIVAITLLGYLPVSTDHVLDFIRPYAPPRIHGLIKSQLDSVLGVHRVNLLSFGVLGTLWLTSRGLRSIIRILNHAYGVEEERPWWRGMAERFFLVVGLVTAMVISLLLPVLLKLVEWSMLQAGLTMVWVRMWVVIRYFLSSLVLLLVFYCLYCFAPNARLGPRDVWPGTLLATLGWQVISVGYSYYVLMSDVTQLYGGLGGIIVLMVWFYLSAMILIVGGQVNAILYERTIKPVQPKR